MKALLDLFKQAHGEEQFDAIKIGCGYYDLFTLPGKMPVQVCVPRSISFARMDQQEFDQLYARALEYVLVELLRQRGAGEAPHIPR